MSLTSSLVNLTPLRKKINETKGRSTEIIQLEMLKVEKRKWAIHSKLYNNIK